MSEDLGLSSCPSCEVLRDELLAVNEFAEIIGSASDIDTLHWVMADTIASILGVDDLVLYLRDGEKLIQKSAFGIKEEDREIFKPIEIPVGAGIVGTAAGTGKSQLINDIATFPGYIPDQYKGASELAVPVIFEKRVIGVFDTESHKKNNYSKRDRQLLERLSRIAAPRIQAAIQRAKLEEAVVFLMEEREQFVKPEIRASGNIPLPGDEVGCFQLNRLLALGEETTLWEATQKDLKRPVILKILHRDKASKQANNFLEKARVASRLHHRNIAEVYGCGEDDGWIWISQEHVPHAQPLAAFLDSAHKLPSLPEDYFSLVFWLLKRATEGLAYAHSQGVTHGDFTVEQLILRPGEEPKIIAFGERATEGDSKSFAEDLRSLVRVIYQTITFRSPDEKNFVPPSLIRPECPPPLDEMCRKFLVESPNSNPTVKGILASLEIPQCESPTKAGGSFFRNWLAKFSGA